MTVNIQRRVKEEPKCFYNIFSTVMYVRRSVDKEWNTAEVSSLSSKKGHAQSLKGKRSLPRQVRLERAESSIVSFFSHQLFTVGRLNECMSKCQVAGSEVSTAEYWNKARITWRWQDNVFSVLVSWVFVCHSLELTSTLFFFFFFFFSFPVWNTACIQSKCAQQLAE